MGFLLNLAMRDVTQHNVRCPIAGGMQMRSKTISRRVLIDLSALFVAVHYGFAPLVTLAGDVFSPRFRNNESFQEFVAEGRHSPFGLDYVFVHSPGARNRDLVDDFCAKVGIRWVNLSKLEWRRIEPRAPALAATATTGGTWTGRFKLGSETAFTSWLRYVSGRRGPPLPEATRNSSI